MKKQLAQLHPHQHQIDFQQNHHEIKFHFKLEENPEFAIEVKMKEIELMNKFTVGILTSVVREPIQNDRVSIRRLIGEAERLSNQANSVSAHKQADKGS